jgi:2',3'-cyclic-nucleotide 2'-phosphodiesterase (5'-nucleotidase family)
VSGIDFIIGGHDHFLFEKPVSVTSPNGKKTLIFQAGESYMYVGKLTFSVDNGRVKVKDYRILPVDCRVRPVPEIQSVVNDLKDGIVAQYGDVYHKVVGFATHELTKAYDPDSRLRDTPLGDLITDACRKKGGTDISIAAHGLISEKIYPGIIVGADVFRAVSYGYDETTGLGFKLVKLQLAGTELVKALEGALSFLGQNDDFFLQVSGMKYRYNATKPIGARVMISSIRIGGKPFDPTATYSITVNEGIAMLLPLLDVNPTGIEPLTDFEYNVVKDYTKSLGIVCYKPEGRIVDVSVLQKEEEEIGEEAAESYDGGTAHEFRLMQNYPNPFNPTTEIRYRMSEFGFVSLKVYDVLGREVATLVDEEKPAGSYTVRFNATGLASGVYYCRLRAGSFVETRKMAMMK